MKHNRFCILRYKFLFLVSSVLKINDFQTKYKWLPDTLRVTDFNEKYIFLCLSSPYFPPSLTHSSCILFVSCHSISFFPAFFFPSLTIPVSLSPSFFFPFLNSFCLSYLYFCLCYTILPHRRLLSLPSLCLFCHY